MPATSAVPATAETTSAVPATAETATAEAAAAEAAKAMATAGAAAKAPGTAKAPSTAKSAGTTESPRGPKSTGAAPKSAGGPKSAGAAPKSVVGAGVGAGRSERRALHRRSTKVRATRTLRRSGGTWHSRHSRCLRRRVCRSRRGVRGWHQRSRQMHRQVRRWELAWRLGRSDLNRLLRRRHVHGG
jgi:hypothetical protein